MVFFILDFPTLNVSQRMSDILKFLVYLSNPSHKFLSRNLIEFIMILLRKKIIVKSNIKYKLIKK